MSFINKYMRDFLADNSDWNQQQLIDASLSLFLGQKPQKSQLEDYQVLVQAIYLSVCCLGSNN